jgi:hypothetical protein
MISEDAPGICIGERGRAWTPNENIETTAAEARVKTIFDIDEFSLFFGCLPPKFERDIKE